jgi:hypothetical protein
MLTDKALKDEDWRFNKVKIIGHNLLEIISIEEVRDVLPQYIVPGPLMLRHVRVLDLSFPSNALERDTQLVECIPALLSCVMPCLKEIDLSNACVPEAVLRSLALCCRVLEKVTWNNHQEASTYMTGEALLNVCTSLREIYMDDSVFIFRTGESQAIHALTEQFASRSIFCHCNANLVRVSLKNAKCREPGTSFSSAPTEPFPQIGLVKFVRSTPFLRWFRSDLSPENVAILRAERPEITFV